MDPFDRKRLLKYRDEKKLTHLYIHKSDRIKYVRYSNYISKVLMENKKVGGKSKLNLLKNVTSKIVEEAFSEGLKPQVMDQGKELCENIYDLIEKEQDLHNLVRDLNELDPDSFNHSYLVTLFSSMILKQFDWESRHVTQSIAFRGHAPRYW